jgi:peptide/nickel transport system ATP-binding protein
MPEILLDIRNLAVNYNTQEGCVKAVENLNLSLHKGETLGLVGETGAGKTTTALAIMRLVPDPPGKIVSGEVYFHNENLLIKKEESLRKIRGNKISMIFQDPMTSLNPVLTVGFQIAEVIMLHQGLDKSQAYIKAESMLELVGIPKDRANDYPHQFSGGMKQRVGIAMALSCNPELLIADEPTTALDVTIQAQVLELMKKLREQFETSMILITHDLGVVAEVCDKVAIMYAGKVVEYAEVAELYTNPKHPYTVGLFGSIPSLDEEIKRLKPIKGSMPDPTNIPSGCNFHPRCPNCMPICRETVPMSVDLGNGHLISCFLYNSLSESEEANVND